MVFHAFGSFKPLFFSSTGASREGELAIFSRSQLAPVQLRTSRQKLRAERSHTGHFVPNEVVLGSVGVRRQRMLCHDSPALLRPRRPTLLSEGLV